MTITPTPQSCGSEYIGYLRIQSQISLSVAPCDLLVTLHNTKTQVHLTLQVKHLYQMPLWRPYSYVSSILFIYLFETGYVSSILTTLNYIFLK